MYKSIVYKGLMKDHMKDMVLLILDFIKLDVLEFLYCIEGVHLLPLKVKRFMHLNMGTKLLFCGSN